MNKDLQRTEQNAPTPGYRKTIGIDLGDRWSRYCILSGDGQIVEEDHSHKHRCTGASIQEDVGDACGRASRGRTLRGLAGC